MRMIGHQDIAMQITLKLLTGIAQFFQAKLITRLLLNNIPITAALNYMLKLVRKIIASRTGDFAEFEVH